MAGAVKAEDGSVPPWAGVRVLVTDGETRTALAAVRALGARGAEVRVLAERAGSLAGVSRFAAEERLAPPGAREPEGWTRAALAHAQALAPVVILPVTDVALGNLFEAGLPEGVGLAAPPAEAWALACDKRALLERAAGVGLPVPPTQALDDPASLSGLPPGFAYPVVLKARRSRWREGGRWCEGGVRRIDDADGLRAARALPDFRAGALLQPWLPGRGEGIFALAKAGRLLASFGHRRLREKPPSGGVSVLAESAQPDPALLAGSERLLAALGWTGVAMLEFRRAPDGSAVLMELNPRLWGSLQLAVDAGADFASAAVALALDRPLPAFAPRAGVRTRWLLGDVDHLLIALRRRAERRATGRSAARVCADFLRSFGDDSRAELWRRGDRRPFWRALREWGR